MDLGTYEICGIVRDRQLAFHNLHLFQDFLRRHPNHTFRGRITVYTEPPSNALIGYFWAEVITRMQTALRSQGTNLTKREVADLVKNYSPIAIDEQWNGEKLITTHRSITELGDQEKRFYIEDLIRFAAEELNLIIKEPRRAI